MPNLRRPGRVDLMLLLMAGMWGTNFSVIKLALVDFPPIEFTAFRFLLASAMMFVLARAGGYSLRIGREEWWAVIGLGLAGNVVYQLLFIYGVARTTADNAALILATVPVFVAVIGSIAGTERVAAWGWGGVVTSLLGIVCIITGGQSGSHLRFGGASVLGDALLLLATLMWSGYTLLMRPVLRRLSSTALTFAVTAVGTVPLLMLTLPGLDADRLLQVPSSSWGWLALSGLIGICLPSFIWNYGVQQLGSARTALYSYLVPFFALVVAWLVLGETLTRLQFFGGALVLLGVLVARRAVRAL